MRPAQRRRIFAFATPPTPELPETVLEVEAVRAAALDALGRARSRCERCGRLGYFAWAVTVVPRHGTWRDVMQAAPSSIRPEDLLPVCRPHDDPPAAHVYAPELDGRRFHARGATCSRAAS
jgi:hypothetical protein